MFRIFRRSIYLLVADEKNSIISFQTLLLKAIPILKDHPFSGQNAKAPVHKKKAANTKKVVKVQAQRKIRSAGTKVFSL